MKLVSPMGPVLYVAHGSELLLGGRIYERGCVGMEDGADWSSPGALLYVSLDVKHRAEIAQFRFFFLPLGTLIRSVDRAALRQGTGYGTCHLCPATHGNRD